MLNSRPTRQLPRSRAGHADTHPAKDRSGRITLALAPEYRAEGRGRAWYKPGRGYILERFPGVVVLIQDIQDTLKDDMTWVQEISRETADRKRLLTPWFFSGHNVCLDARNVQTQRLSKKLDNKLLRYFEVIKDVKTYGYRIVLLPTMEIHPVFHISRLERVAEESLKEQIIPPPPPIEFEGEEEYKVHEILILQIYWRCLEYLVKWVRYE